MNIDFAHHLGFSLYVLLLMATGITMVAIGTPMVRRVTRLQRALNLTFGVGFFAYGFYLAFVFTGGTYVLFFKAFILPAYLIARTVQGVRASTKPAPAVGRPETHPAEAGATAT